jgi:hypothetical protein
VWLQPSRSVALSRRHPCQTGGCISRNPGPVEEQPICLEPRMRPLCHTKSHDDMEDKRIPRLQGIMHPDTL